MAARTSHKSARGRRPAKARPGKAGARRSPERLGTRAVHAGEPHGRESGALGVPIFQSATYSSPSTRAMLEVAAGRTEGNFYLRYGNTTTRAVERKLAALDEAQDALLFSSGMAAITTTLLSMVKSGDHILSSNAIYGNAQSFMQNTLSRFGVEVTFADATDPAALARLVRPRTRMLYAESPVNPTLAILDLPRLAQVARKAKIPFLLDATFSSPVNQQSLKLGVTLALHSATKYLGGHSDLLAGAACGPRALIGRIREMRKSLGGVADPHQAWLLARGMRTLEVRVNRQNEVALHVARWLERHPRVVRTLYPGLRSHPQHALARRQMKGFGGMVTFEVRGGVKGASRVADRLRLISLAPSLGGVESVICQPVLTSHRYVTEQDRRAAGIRDGMLRLSCGIEDPRDLVADLDRALRG